MYIHNDIIIKNATKSTCTQSKFEDLATKSDDGLPIFNLIDNMIDYILSEKTNIYHMILVFVTNDVFTAVIIVNMIIDKELTSDKAKIILERMLSETERVRPLMFTLLMCLKMKQTQTRTLQYHHVYNNIYKFVIRNMMP